MNTALNLTDPDTAIDSNPDVTPEALAPESSPIERAATPASPEDKPRTRSRPKTKGNAVQVTPTPEATTATLERIHASNRNSAIRALQQTVDKLDALLRDTTPPKYHPLMTLPPAWLRRPGLMLRSRAGAASRLRWLERRAEGIREPFAEPTPAELVQQFTVACRFSSLARLGAMRNHFSVVQTDVEVNSLRDVARVRIKMSELTDSSYLGSVERLPSFKTWSVIEAKLAILTAREAKLAERHERIRRALSPLARTMEARVRAVFEETGSEVLAKAVYRNRDPERATAPTTNPAIKKAEEQLASVLGVINSSGPPNSERAAVIAEIRKPIDETIRQNLAHLAAEHAAARAPALAEIHAEVVHMSRGIDGWRTLGEMADRNPWVFPQGFADRWLGAVAAAMAEASPEGMMELIDAA